jgi:hypothetical protein
MYSLGAGVSLLRRKPLAEKMVRHGARVTALLERQQGARHAEPLAWHLLTSGYAAGDGIDVENEGAG